MLRLLPFFRSVAVALPLLCATPALALQNATLAWDPNSEPDLAGYRLYYGTAPGVYDQVLEVTGASSVSAPNLNECTTYYFVVTAVNSAGMESAPSTEVTYQAPDSFAAWQSRENVSAPDLDTDQDGLCSLTEYAMGTNPHEPGTPPEPSIEGPALSMVFTRNKQAADVRITPEVADSPAGPWQSGPGLLVETVLAEDDAQQTIQVTDTTPVETAGSRFLRLRIETATAP